MSDSQTLFNAMAQDAESVQQIIALAASFSRPSHLHWVAGLRAALEKHRCSRPCEASVPVQSLSAQKGALQRLQNPPSARKPPNGCQCLPAQKGSPPAAVGVLQRRERKPPAAARVLQRTLWAQ